MFNSLQPNFYPYLTSHDPHTPGMRRKVKGYRGAKTWRRDQGPELIIAFSLDLKLKVYLLLSSEKRRLRFAV